MPSEIVPNKDPTAEMLCHYADVLSNYRARMSPHVADRYLGVRSGTVKGAIERHEIECINVHGTYKVTPKALAEWIETHLTQRAEPLPN